MNENVDNVTLPFIKYVGNDTYPSQDSSDQHLNTRGAWCGFFQSIQILLFQVHCSLLLLLLILILILIQIHCTLPLLNVLVFAALASKSNVSSGYWLHLLPLSAISDNHWYHAFLLNIQTCYIYRYIKLSKQSKAASPHIWEAGCYLSIQIVTPTPKWSELSYNNKGFNLDFLYLPVSFILFLNPDATLYLNAAVDYFYSQENYISFSTFSVTLYVLMKQGIIGN